jgi:hypothetical protein
MSRLMKASRLGRAVCELSIRSRSQMPFVVTPGDGRESLDTVRSIALALGYQTLDLALPLDTWTTAASVGRDASEALARAGDAAVIVLDARAYDGGEVHRAIVDGLAHLSSEAWSVNGQTHLFVLSGEDPVVLARRIGETLSDHTWASAIPL